MATHRRPLIVGLTGGIGSGKSTVAALFAERYQIPVIDTDQLAREVLVVNPQVIADIIHHFGDGIVDVNGDIDRKKLGFLVFAKKEERIWLETLLHPLIRELIKEKIERVTAPYCIVVIPLLFEAHCQDWVQRILVVDVDEKIQIERTLQRDRITPIQIQQIMESQVTRQYRLEGADDVIDNSLTTAELLAQVERLHGVYWGLGRKS